MSVLFPLNKSKTKFEGLLNVNAELHRIHIEKSNVISRFNCDWKLHHKLKHHKQLIEKRLQHCSDVTQFWKELQLLLDSKILNFNEKHSAAWNASYYDIVLKHIQDLGWENVLSIDDHFLNMSLQVYDSAGRKHKYGLSLTFAYPSDAPKVSATLPSPFIPLWTCDSDLLSIHNQFSLYVNQFERLWGEVDELQQNAWILEPDSPNFAATSFRIALSKTSSIHVKVDPQNLNVVPECHFVGAEWSIASLRENFQNKYEDWNENLSLYQNLKNILDVNFPEKQPDSSQDLSLRCGICYTFRLGMSVPDQICNDKRCGKPFHHECLLEWVRSRPEAKQSFNVVFGECPYCTHAIKISLLRN